MAQTQKLYGDVYLDSHKSYALIGTDSEGKVVEETVDLSSKEDSLGNPAVDDYILSSKTDGTRSWVELPDPDLSDYLKLNQTTPQTTVGTFTFPISRAVSFGFGATYQHSITTNTTSSVGSSVFIGENAGKNRPTSVGIGKNALDAGSSSSQNVAVGFEAGRTTINLTNCTLIGYQAGKSISGGTNTYIGANTGQSVIGSSNTGIGSPTLYATGNASSCTAIGSGSISNSAGIQSNVTAIGSASGEGNNFTTANCTFIGNSAGRALRSTTSALLCLGNNAGYFASSANNSLFIGASSGAQSTNLNNSVAVGANTGYGSSGDHSLLIGSSAGYFINSSRAVVLGYLAGYIIQADNITSVGSYSGYTSYLALNSSFFGYSSGHKAENADYATYLGFQSGYDSTNGGYSVFVGESAGYQATDAGNSIFIGSRAGYQDTVENSITGVISIIDTNSFADAGTLLNVDDEGTISTGDANATIKVTEITLGSVSSVTIIDGGYGYAEYDTLTLDGGGYNAQLTVETVDGPASPVETVSIAQGGYGYDVGHTLYLEGGNWDAYVTVDSVDDYGAVTAVTVSWGGTNYDTGEVYTYSWEGGYDCTINIDGVGSTVGMVTWVSIEDGGTGYDTSNEVYSSSYSGQGFVCSIDSIEDGSAKTIALVDGGTGYKIGGYDGSNTVTDIGDGNLAVYIRTISSPTVSGTSIAIGRYAGTGGYSDSIAIGRGVINSATSQANIGNVLFLEGIYNSDTQSATPMTAGVVKVGGVYQLPDYTAFTGTPAEGMMGYDFTNSYPVYYDGSNWVQI
jgi:hypothetical protein